MKPRKIFRKLYEQRNNHKISILLGPRQVGKTTLLNELFNILSEKHKCLFLDLDILSNYEKISTYDSLLNLLRINDYEDKSKSLFYLFLDEFQKYEDVTLLMKNVYDNLPNVKIYASGSSSLKIKDNIKESLAGRKLITHIYPLDFEEFLIFKGEEEKLNRLKNVHKLKGKGLEKQLKDIYLLLEEFMVFGGYPEVVLSRNKQEVLDSIFDLYVRKDLSDYLRDKNILNAKKLIEYLAVNNAQKIKYEELGSFSSLDYSSVKYYLQILEESYLVILLRPFYTNKNKELTKIPKAYFLDPGVRNYFIKNFNNLDLRQDAGFLFETFVLSEIVKLGIDKEALKFWQDKNQHEVDIIMDLFQRKAAIEVKYKVSVKSEDLKGMSFFGKEYPEILKKFVVNLGIKDKKENISLILPFEIEDFLS